MGKKSVLFKIEAEPEPIFPANPFAPEEKDPQGAIESISELVWDYTIDALKKVTIDPLMKVLNISEGWDRIKYTYNRGDRACDRLGQEGSLNIELPGLFNWNLCISGKAAQQFIADPVKGVGHGVMCYVETSIVEPVQKIIKTVQEAGNAKKLFNNLTELIFTPELPLYPNIFRMWDCFSDKLATDAAATSPAPQ